MSDQTKTELPCGEYDRGAPWKPLRRWWPSSRSFSQDVGLPPFLEAGEAWWLSLAAATWPGVVPAPLFVPYMSRLPQQPSQKISKESCKWTVSLDVAHFSPSDIFLSVKDGSLVVEGKHEERRDEHGFIARCFTRKYRLPGEIVAAEITSTLSADGILTVEAPVPEESVPTVTIIPIKVEMEETEEKEKTHEEEALPESAPDVTTASEVPESTGDDVVETTAVQTDQDQPGNVTAAPQQQEEKTEPEEKEEEEEVKAEIDPKPVEDPLPSEPADDSDKESRQESSEQHKDPESQETPDTDTSKQVEPGEPSQSEEIKVEGGSNEAAEEIPAEEQELGKIPASEVTSQEQEASEIKDEHTE